MGTIHFNGLLLFSGKVGEVQTHDNWCDSMAEYYPCISISHMREDGEISWQRVSVPHNNPISLNNFVITYDPAEVAGIAAYRRKREAEIEANTYRLHKLVKVVRGRKVPIGTEGEISWMGETPYGPRIGIRLLDGTVVFTARSNTQLINVDKEIEKILLGEGNG